MSIFHHLTSAAIFYLFSYVCSFPSNFRAHSLMGIKQISLCSNGNKISSWSTEQRIEAELVDCIGRIGGRGARATIEEDILVKDLVKKLENLGTRRSPTKSESIDGSWKLLYTSTPSTNSPIQRTFTAIDGFSIFQVVNILNTSNSFLAGQPDVSNVVCFGNNARLRVTALASTVLT